MFDHDCAKNIYRRIYPHNGADTYDVVRRNCLRYGLHSRGDNCRYSVEENAVCSVETCVVRFHYHTA